MSLDEFRRFRETMNAKILAADHLGIKRFFALDSAAYRDGALDGRTKELLGLVASLVLRCNDCVDYHLRQCVEAGFSDDELDDALALHVHGSAAVEPAVPDGAGERRHRPARGVRGHDVHVMEQEDGLAHGSARRLQARHEGDLPGRGLVPLDTEPFALEDALKERGGFGDVPRRDGGIESNVAAQRLGRFRRRRFPVDFLSQRRGGQKEDE